MKHLILGGARSGKSRFAEETARASTRQRIYVATAQGLDDEMQQRIAHHQQQRAADGWQTIEEPLALGETLRQHCTSDTVVLVDCLTLWLTNLLLAGEDTFQREKTSLLDSLPTLPGELLLVSNEVGLGVVPMDPLSRRFVDEAGRLHQALGALCERVTFVAAALPLRMK